MNGDLIVKVFPADFMYAPVTSCSVERSLNQYKYLLSNYRRKFTCQRLKEMFVTHYHGNAIKK